MNFLNLLLIAVDVHGLLGAGLSDFNLDAYTGRLTIARNIDRERQASYSLTLVAMNKALLSVNSTVTANITILDRDDNLPMCLQPQFVFDIPENAHPGAVIGTVDATDPDLGDNSAIQFSVLLGNSGHFFNIDPSLGRISLNQTIDREALSLSSISLTVRVSFE